MERIFGYGTRSKKDSSPEIPPQSGDSSTTQPVSKTGPASAPESSVASPESQPITSVPTDPTHEHTFGDYLSIQSGKINASVKITAKNNLIATTSTTSEKPKSGGKGSPPSSLIKAPLKLTLRNCPADEELLNEELLQSVIINLIIF